MLTGRLALRGDTLIVSAELVDAQRGSQIWGEQYRRKGADIFEVQDEISREITEKLQLRLNREQKKRLVKHPTANTAAYHLYLRGRYHWNQWNPDGYRKALEHYHRALTAGERIAKAREASLRALQLDESLPEAHSSLGMVKLCYDWEWAVAEKEFRRAIELNPNCTNAYHWYSHLLVALGRWVESLAVSLRARELDPLDVEMTVHLAFHHIHARQYDLAIEDCWNALGIDSNFHECYWFLGWAYGLKGSFEQAIAALEKSLSFFGGTVAERGTLGWVYGQAGRRQDAERVLGELVELSRKRYVCPYYVALVHIALGRTSQAMDCLESAADDRATWIPYINVSPVMDPLRADPRFQKLLRRVELS